MSGPGGRPVQHAYEIDPNAKAELFAKINAMSANLARARDIPAIGPAAPALTTAHEEEKGPNP